MYCINLFYGQIKCFLAQGLEWQTNKSVVYLDQQMGAPHAVCWLKTSFLMLKQLFANFKVIKCLFCSVSDGKSGFSVRKSISTSEQCAEHPFAGLNTQQKIIFSVHSALGLTAI